MSSAIERPVFFENQNPGAADLTAAVDLGRGQQARHNRYLHLWGIAAGLELTSEKDPDREGKVKITLSPGVAIDGRGREIIVSQKEELSEATFSQLGVSSGVTDPDELFPVFLVGIDQKTPQPPLMMGACTSSSATRISEAYEIKFGRPNEARDLEIQESVDVQEGPGTGNWKILLGFVKWDGGFTGLQNDKNGISRKYAGVQADEVAARGGSLHLRTQTKPQDKKPAVIIDETEDGRLRFGSLNAEGKLNAVFTVNAKGDLKVAGTITSAVSVQVQSGVVMDGLLLPLPPGINFDDIDSGKLILHVHVTPSMNQDFAPFAAEWAIVPVECFVDSNHRVHCRVHWLPLPPNPGPAQTTAGFCDYFVMVSVPAATGS